MKGAPKWPKASEYCRWLDQFHMFMQALWKTVAGRSDDALAANQVSVYVIFLDSSDLGMGRERKESAYCFEHFLRKCDRDANSDPILG